MAASTGPRNKYAKLDRPFKVAYPIAASTKLNKDTLVSFSGGVGGPLTPTKISSTDLFAGVVESTHDNSGGVLGGIQDPPVLKEGSHAFIWGPGSPTAATVNGAKCYALDDQTVTNVVTTNALYVGEGIYDPDPDIVGAGMIRVRIDKAVN
jgi:hypothetical protein